VITASRYHDFSYGHRVAGHESKCAFLHGHNGRVHFTVRARERDLSLDEVGRVLDFSAINTLLCAWVERNWDHHFLMWTQDPWQIDVANPADDSTGIIRVPFNPTAENMARYLVEIVGPAQLINTGVDLIEVTLEETRKCRATVTAERKFF
jgi:6-pyruvoyltetrahydropterin/6-carboxytetrahydropterin synthase